MTNDEVARLVELVKTKLPMSHGFGMLRSRSLGEREWVEFMYAHIRYHIRLDIDDSVECVASVDGLGTSEHHTNWMRGVLNGKVRDDSGMLA